MKHFEIAVKQHDDGVFYVRPYLGVNAVTGKAIRPYKRFPEAVDEDEARELAAEWLDGLEGAARLGVSLRMSDVMARYCDAMEPSWTANTAKAYRNCARWLEPVIGDVDADELKPHLVDAAYNVLLLRGGRGGNPLSQASVRQCHDFLCGAFKWAVKAEVVPFNPMPSTTKPRLDRAEASAFKEAEFSAIYAKLISLMEEPETLEGAAAIAAWLSLMTGVRCGEACALAVGDVSVAVRSIHVAATVVEPKGSNPVRQRFTKGHRSRNVSIGEKAAEELGKVMLRRRGFLPSHIGAEYSRPLVCSPKGDLMRPSVVSRAFTRIRRELGLPDGTSFHTLRHTHATMLIASGADMRTVQERLGHANVATTLSLYAHVVPGRDRAAAEAFERAARETGGAL